MSNKVLSIVGPTGVGKSNLALWLARQCKDLGQSIEIISMDSALVYKGMNIGTAKPSKAEQGEVVHHLIDILDPSQNYSAAQFASDAKELITDIKLRGNIPLIVGGTMLYWRVQPVYKQMIVNVFSEPSRSMHSLGDHSQSFLKRLRVLRAESKSLILIGWK